MSSNSYLILQDLVKKELLNSKNLKNQNTLPIKKINLHEQPTQARATAEEAAEAEEMVEDVIKWAEIAGYGIDILAIAATIYTGGLAGVAYSAGRKGLQVALMAGARKYGRKAALRKFKRIAIVAARKANPRRVANRIRKSLATSKLSTAVAATKYYLVGDLLTDWKHTRDVGNVIIGQYTAMMEQKRATLVAGNKARVAVASNTIEDGPEKLKEFIKAFFTMHTNYEAYDAPMNANLARDELEDYSEYRDPELWKLDTQILEMITSDEIINIFNSGLESADELFITSNVSDKYNQTRKNIINIQPKAKEIISSKYFEIFKYLRDQTGGTLSVLGDLVDGGLSADYLVVGETTAAAFARFWSSMFLNIVASGKTENLGIAHPQYFALCCLKLYQYGLTSKIPFGTPFTKLVETNLKNKLINIEPLLNKFNGTIIDSDGKPFNFDDLSDVKFNTGEEEQSDPYSTDDFSAYEAGKMYDDIPGGIEADDPRMGKLHHSPDAMAHVGAPQEYADLQLQVSNIFQTNKNALKKSIENLSYEIFENYNDESEEFLNIFQNFALTILLDPSGQGFGGYEKVAECNQWFSQKAQDGFKDVVKEVGLYPQLLGNLIFYYSEVYIINKPFAAIWTKFVEQKGLRKLPKALKVGTMQNMMLVLSGFLALAFLDPLNQIDKGKILDILTRAKRLAYKYASKQNGGAVSLEKCKEQNSFPKPETRRSYKDGADMGMPPRTAVPGTGRGKVKEQKDLKWELTEKQNQEIMQLIYSSFDELEKEVNQTLSELFEWSSQVQKAQKIPKKFNMQKPGASLECEIYLARKEIRNNISELQKGLRTTFEEMTKNQTTFKIDSTNYAQVNCLFDEMAVELGRVFDQFKMADISPLTGDSSIDENKINYLQKYILENKNILQEVPGLDNPAAVTPNSAEISAAAAAAEPDLVLGAMSLGEYYNYLQEKFKISASNAWLVCKLLDFAGYHRISSPEGENSEWFSWEKDTGILVGASNIDKKDILANMKSNYTKFRYNYLRPSREAANYKYWKNNIDHRFGSFARGEITNLFHLEEKAAMNSTTYNIVGISRVLGYDNKFIQSNIVGSFLRHASPVEAYKIIDNFYGNIGFHTLKSDFQGNQNFERTSSGLKKNTNIDKELTILNSSNMTQADVSITKHDSQNNLLTSCQSYVNDAVSQGLWNKSWPDTEGQLNTIFASISGTTAVLSPRETKHLGAIIKICKNVGELFVEWNKTMNNINIMANANSNASLGKNNIKNFEQLAANVKDKKTLSEKWFSQEEAKISEEQKRLDKYIVNVVKLIKIDEMIGNSIN